MSVVVKLLNAVSHPVNKWPHFTSVHQHEQRDGSFRLDFFTLQQCFPHPFDHLFEVAHLHVNLRKLQFLPVCVNSACYMSTDPPIVGGGSGTPD